MRGIIYRYRVENNKPRLDHWTIDFSEPPPDTVMTKQVAYQYFKTAQKQFRISGKEFSFFIGGKSFILGKTKGEFTIFSTGEENEKRSEPVVG